MKVGLTGGIGSGKSAVARLLVEHGALVVDADAVAREVVAPGSAGLAQIADRFGGGSDVPRDDVALRPRTIPMNSAARSEVGCGHSSPTVLVGTSVTGR